MHSKAVSKIKKNIKVSAAVKPDHYRKGSIQPLEFIEEWNLNFCLGNVVKYICRAPYKGTQLQDLKKAQAYLAREIARVEKNG